MALKDIIGHKKALNILRGCVAKNRIPHALLFAGEDGIGKKLTAVNFAKTLNCQNTEHRTQNTDKSKDKNSLGSGPWVLCSGVDSCDECSSCKKIDKAIHPDVFLIEPEGDGKQIKISSIRQLQESLSYKPFEGRWKIAIIDNAETLNKPAANAFLETLEQPPPQSILILISSRPEILLATIRSRCQRINFSPLPFSVMEDLLKDKFKGLSSMQFMILSALSGGRIGYAMNESLLKERDESFNEFKAMLDNPEKELWGDRDDMKEWFDWSQLWLRDIAVFKATGQTDLLINQDKEREIKDISKNAKLKDILKLARELYDIRGFLHFNLNKQLTLYHTSLLLKKMLGRSGCYGG